MAATAILKIGFLAITHWPIVWFQWNFVRGSRTACRQGLYDKNCNFFNPRWRTVAILKIVKSPYLNGNSSDFDEIWYTTSDIEPGFSHVTKNWNFWYSRWRSLKFAFFGHNSSIDCLILATFYRRKQNGMPTKPTW